MSGLGCQVDARKGTDHGVAVSVARIGHRHELPLHLIERYKVNALTGESATGFNLAPPCTVLGRNEELGARSGGISTGGEDKNESYGCGPYMGSELGYAITIPPSLPNSERNPMEDSCQ